MLNVPSSLVYVRCSCGGPGIHSLAARKAPSSFVSGSAGTSPTPPHSTRNPTAAVAVNRVTSASSPGGFAPSSPLGNAGAVPRRAGRCASCNPARRGEIRDDPPDERGLGWVAAVPSRHRHVRWRIRAGRGRATNPPNGLTQSRQAAKKERQEDNSQVFLVFFRFLALGQLWLSSLLFLCGLAALRETSS